MINTPRALRGPHLDIKLSGYADCAVTVQVKNTFLELTSVSTQDDEGCTSLSDSELEFCTGLRRQFSAQPGGMRYDCRYETMPSGQPDSVRKLQDFPKAEKVLYRRDKQRGVCASTSWARMTSQEENEEEEVAPPADWKSELSAAAETSSDKAPQEAAIKSKKKASPPSNWKAGTTTVMVRNLPNKYTQRMMLRVFHQQGFDPCQHFDFFYLPIDRTNSANLGYAFVNFSSEENAIDFANAFQGCRMKRFHSRKTIAVVPATMQGYEANKQHYSTTRVVHVGDLQCRPLFLKEPVHASLAAKALEGPDGEMSEEDGLVEAEADTPVVSNWTRGRWWHQQADAGYSGQRGQEIVAAQIGVYANKASESESPRSQDADLSQRSTTPCSSRDDSPAGAASPSALPQTPRPSYTPVKADTKVSKFAAARRAAPWPRSSKTPWMQKVDSWAAATRMPPQGGSFLACCNCLASVQWQMDYCSHCNSPQQQQQQQHWSGC
eukprot:TRINITY_DN100483_c0_g1_i1.p1 TRINITY_DN100483_c0_g1~~TRINITY_DN100483_c0_g1_i1.p1  ORF type:complete len:493 (-),score=92.07 TRINITY_DN100483_c0_g1_i1:216-1694(-)